jgi:hypothetical protein
MNTEEYLKVRISRWIENAKRNVGNLQDELKEPYCVNPSTLASRMSDHLSKIEAWEEVIRVLN